MSIISYLYKITVYNLFCINTEDLNDLIFFCSRGSFELKWQRKEYSLPEPILTCYMEIEIENGSEKYEVILEKIRAYCISFFKSQIPDLKDQELAQVKFSFSKIKREGNQTTFDF